MKIRKNQLVFSQSRHSSIFDRIGALSITVEISVGIARSSLLYCGPAGSQNGPRCKKCYLDLFDCAHSTASFLDDNSLYRKTALVLEITLMIQHHERSRRS